MSARFLGWLHAPAPAERLAALRILVAGYCTVMLLARSSSFWSSASLPDRQFEPVGVLWFLGSAPAVVVAHLLFLAAIAVGCLATAGWRWRVTGPAFAALFLVVTTSRLSWGHVIHTEHLASVHLCLLAFAPAADAWSRDALRRSNPPGPPSDRYGVPIRWMGIALVVTYVLAGWMKLRNGGGDWMTGGVLRNQIAYDNLRKELLGSPHSPLGGWLVQFDGVFHPIAWITVAVELGAPLALLGGRIRTTWALLAWAFHVGIVALMAISFPYPVSGIAYACLFRPERVIAAVGRLANRSARSAPRSGTMEPWQASRTG